VHQVKMGHTQEAASNTSLHSHSKLGSKHRQHERVW